MIIVFRKLVFFIGVNPFDPYSVRIATAQFYFKSRQLFISGSIVQALEKSVTELSLEKQVH